jgi:aspartate/tyrosine/aromatic aminotransferase
VCLQELYAGLTALNTPGDWKHILNQIGMFSYTGLSPPQVKNLTAKWHIYLTADGRISMAGLNAAKCKYLAEAMHDSVTNF